MKGRLKIVLPVLFILLAAGIATYFTRQAAINSLSPDDGYLRGLMMDEQSQPVADTPQAATDSPSPDDDYLYGLMIDEQSRPVADAPQEAIDSPSPDDGYLHGLMIDEQNRPVADTPVTLVVQRSLGINCASRQCDLFNKPVFYTREKTDEQGRFSMRVPQRYLANRGQPSMYIYKLEVDIALQKIKFFYNLALVRQETNEQTFIVKPPFLTME